MTGRAVAELEEESDTGGAAPPLLEARGLVRTFGAVTAVDDVSFGLAPGEFLTVFGPNGAGKSTLLRMLGGGLKPTSGQVLIGGHVLDPRTDGWRHRLGVLSHQSFLYGHLTCAENLRFFGRLYGLRDLTRRIPERLGRVDLLRRADDPVRSLSRGMRQRLALARTLLHDPEVVLLDEPYTGLDAHAADVLREVLSALRDGRRTVVLVTHNLTQGLELADRVVVQVNGRIAFDEPRRTIDAASFEHRYREVVEGAS
ncbi:MAG TPA: heme ABC exporter ATP-binding protein CcmA [Longimicrobiales bacterium]|nr:heme ABC exporter ATP-binding protein CcmA [Longimicrobiales bacterium]